MQQTQGRRQAGQTGLETAQGVGRMQKGRAGPEIAQGAVCIHRNMPLSNVPAQIQVEWRSLGATSSVTSPASGSITTLNTSR